MRRPAAALAASILLAGCASTGATFRSGVGDTFLAAPPWYAGRLVTGTVAHLPISFQAGATQPASFDPASDAGTPMATLLREMNAYLDSLRTGAPALAEQPAGTPPDVHFGCEHIPDDDCESDDGRRMRLAVGRPSREWIGNAAAAAHAAGADRVLVLTLEVGNYMPRQRGWTDKEVQLGTGHSIEVPFLTSLDRPASVLQLTGVVVDTAGYAVRIGTEGLMARRTNIVLSGLGVQAVISDDDVEKVRTLRRDDLPGKPLAWRVALENIVAQLTNTHH